MSANPTDQAKPPRLTLRQALVNLWRPKLLPEDRDLLPILRIYVPNLLFGFVAMPVALIVGVAMAFHAPIPQAVFFLFLGIAAASYALTQALRALMLIRRGKYRGLDGTIVLRAERPVRFWILVASNVLATAIMVVATVFLLTV